MTLTMRAPICAPPPVEAACEDLFDAQKPNMYGQDSGSCSDSHSQGCPGTHGERRRQKKVKKRMNFLKESNPLKFFYYSMKFYFQRCPRSLSLGEQRL